MMWLIRAWWGRFVDRHIVTKDRWDLYIFPGGKVGSTTSHYHAKWWTSQRKPTEGERRAISQQTDEHIVNGTIVWPK